MTMRASEAMDQEDEEDIGEDEWHLPADVNGGGFALPPTDETPSEDKAATAASDDSAWRVALNTHKAGMQGLDKERINRIILEATRGSRFYENEMKKEEQVQHRVERQRAQLSTLSRADRALARQEADAFMAQAEEKRDLTRLVVHVDMDMFYAAVEMLDKPWLKDKPMAVGSMGMMVRRFTLLCPLCPQTKY